MRADRALSGRLVCNSCGTPYGVRRRGNKKINKFNIFSLNKDMKPKHALNVPKIIEILKESLTIK